MELYDYQVEGAEWLASLPRAYLADGMGIGKSAQACHAAGLVDAKSVLVIAPASTLLNWRREWETWGSAATFHVVSYGSLRKAKGEWDVVILDEAHYVKNPGAQRTRLALAIAAKARHVWCLSGTPMPNDPTELFPVFAALWPEVLVDLGLSTADDWLNRFCRYGIVRYNNGPPTARVYGTQNLDQLKPHLRGMMKQRHLRDVALELPPLRVDIHRLPRDKGLLDALAATGIDPDNAVAMIERAEGDPEGSLSRLRRLLGEYKAPLIAAEIAKELRDGAMDKIVVLAYHRSVLRVFHKELAGYGVTGFDGSTSQVDRQRAIDAFTKDDGCKVFVAQQNAAGVGINLQVSSEIVLVEPAWSPDDNAQAIKRIHRIGSTAPCRARIFAIADSMDEAIMGTLQRKLRMQRDIGLKHDTKGVPK